MVGRLKKTSGSHGRYCRLKKIDRRHGRQVKDGRNGGLVKKTDGRNGRQIKKDKRQMEEIVGTNRLLKIDSRNGK